MDRVKLTRTQHVVLDFIVDGWRNGLTPSLRDIQREFSYGKSTVRDHMKRLAALGYIEPRGVGKTFRITNKGMAFESKRGLNVKGGCFESVT